MVLGQADGPFLDRHLARGDLDLAGGVQAFLLASPAEHERPGIAGVGQEVVHRRIVRGRPPHAPLADAPARKLLALRDQLADDLARRAEPVPQLEDALDRVAHLLVGGQHDAPILVAIEPDGEVHPQLAALGLGAQPAVQTGADQVQLGLGHRALEPKQQPVVELRRRVDPVGVGDQRPGQRAQIDQLVPVRRGAREPRHLEGEDQPDVSEADLGDELLKPQPAGSRGARAAGVLVDYHDRGGRPAQIDRAIPQRILALRGLGVALDLHERRLAHIHDRTALTVAFGDLLMATHRAPPPPTPRVAARA
jgi:hypothetical protein